MLRIDPYGPGSRRRRTRDAGSERPRPLIARLAVAGLLTVLAAACSGGAATRAPSAAVPSAAAPSAGAASVALPSGAGASASTAGCGDTPKMGNGKKQIAWAIGLHDLSVIAQMDQEMKKYASERGWEMLLDQGTAGNVQAMTSSIQSWITQGVPAMTVTSDDPSAMAPLQKQALEKGLIWNVYGTQDMPRNPDAFVGFPSTEGGKKGADVVTKYINEKDPNAKVLILTQVTNPGGKPREELPKQAIQSQTKATVVAEQDGSDQVKGLQATQTALRANPDLSVVVARTDAGALGAAQAFKQAGISADKVYILTYDGSLQSLEELKDEGYIKTIIALDLKLLADTVAQTNIDLALCGAPAQHVDKIVPTDVVDKNSPKLQQLIDFYKSAS